MHRGPARHRRITQSVLQATQPTDFALAASSSARTDLVPLTTALTDPAVGQSRVAFVYTFPTILNVSNSIQSIITTNY